MMEESAAMGSKPTKDHAEDQNVTDGLGAIVKPENADQVLAIIQQAVAEQKPLEIIGHGSKRLLGRRVEAETCLDLSSLTGVTLYEPDELVLSARAGTSLAEIQTLLDAQKQELAFEPMDYGPLLGEMPGRGTIGGVLAANISGPRRLRAGAARDHILGIHAVSGRGEPFKSGGRVVKNVTGYDMSKAMAGSWGTLAVLTDVTFKVLPRCETQATFLLRGLSEMEAIGAMSLALGSTAEVSAAAHLPDGISGPKIAALTKGGAATLLRLEGFGPSVNYRFDLLHRLLSRAGEVERLENDISQKLWAMIRDVIPFADGSKRPVWRVSMTPTRGVQMVDELRRHAGVAAFYDWQGGLIWLRFEAEPEGQILRALIARHGGGHATLVRATPEQRATCPSFQPEQPALAALSQRLKEQFDPSLILNRGRMD